MIPASPSDWCGNETFSDSNDYLEGVGDMNILYPEYNDNVLLRMEHRTLNTINAGGGIDDVEDILNDKENNDKCDNEMNKKDSYMLIHNDDLNITRLVNPRAVCGEYEAYTPYVDHSYGLTPPTTEGTSGSEVDVVTLPDERRRSSVPKSFKVGKKQTRRAPKKARQTISIKNASTKRTRPLSSREKKKRQKLADSPPTTDDETERRAIHNTSERQRREMQREHLQNLRLQIPKLAGNEKAAKVTILQSAKKHIDELGAGNTKQIRAKCKLLEKTTKNQIKLLSLMVESYKKSKKQGDDVNDQKDVLLHWFGRLPYSPPTDWDS